MSSSVVKDMDRLNQRQIENLKRRQGREVRNLENAHQNYKTELKKSHDEEIVDLKDVQQRQVATEVDRKEKFLDDLKTNMKQTQDLTEKQLKTFKDQANNERQDTHAKLSTDRDRIQNEHELYLENLNDRFQTESRKINVDGQGRITEMERTLNQRYADTVAHQNKKLNDQTNEFTARFQKDSADQKRIKDESDSRFKKERIDANRKQQVELSQQSDTHAKTFEARDTEFRKGLKEQDDFFEKKFAHQLQSHNKTLKDLDDRHGQILRNLKTDFTEDVTKITEKSDDPFYQFLELKPVMTKTETGVEIRVNVPEYAKQDLHLNINNKEAVLNFNRRYTENNKSPEGYASKVNKVESMTSRLNTGMILDPKSLKSNYEDGTMIYTISRA